MLKKGILLSFAASGALFADGGMTELKQITVSAATKTEKAIDGVAASVIVIDEESIKKSGAESVKEILEKTPRINIQYGTFPSASSKSKSSINIRGLGAKGTLLLLDGRRLAGEVANPYDMDRIPVGEIERIEIVKGPMSVLYGADATGGVINIITKQPTKSPAIDFGIRYGQNSDGDDTNKNANLSIRGKRDNLGYSFYINKTVTTPYGQNERGDVYAKTATGKSKPSAYPAAQNGQLSSKLKNSYDEEVTYREDSDIVTYGGRLEYDFGKDIKVGFEVNRFFEERDGKYIGYFHPTNFNIGATQNKIAAYNVPVNSKDNNNRLDIAADLSAKLTKDLTLKAKVYKSKYEKKNKTTAVNWADMGYASEEASAQNGMDANVDIRALESSLSYSPSSSHLLTGGYEYRDENREAMVFTQANTMSEKNVAYKALYLQDEWEMGGGFNSILGARFDDVGNAEDKATFKIGVIKKINDALNARGIFSQGYRAPDLRELYMYKQTAGGTTRGALTADVALGKKEYELKPEATDSFELGVGGKYGKLRYDAAIFCNKIKNMIAEVNKGAYYTFENLDSAKTYGLEFDADYTFSDELVAKFAWNELKSRDDDNDRELEFNPDRTVSLKFEYSPLKTISTSVGAKYVGKQFYKETIARGTPTERVADAKTNGYTTVDLGANYDYSKNLNFYVGINNIFDKKIDDVLGSGSGIYFFSGLKVRF